MVGMMLVGAYEATGDRQYLDTARKAADALISGLSESPRQSEEPTDAPPAASRRATRPQSAELPLQ
jgi:uncharacterized protein YyaL (SSP411 family)